MEKGSNGTKRFIIICCLFFSSVLIGGGILIVYVFFPDLSDPWQLGAAMALIGLPWVFWLLAYLYTWLKLCIFPKQDQPRRGGPNMHARSMAASRKGGSGVESGDAQHHVHFGDHHKKTNGQENPNDSSNHSRESEMPLNSSVPSS